MHRLAGERVVECGAAATALTAWPSDVTSSVKTTWSDTASIAAMSSSDSSSRLEGAVDAIDRDGTFLERLAQSLDGRARELSELVEEQDAVVGDEISPWRGELPPPIRAAVEIVWCGARNGRVSIRPWARPRAE